MDQLKKPPDKQQDSAVSVPQPSTEGTKRATTRRRSRENNRKQQEEQDAQEQLMKAYRAETSYKPSVILASEAEGSIGSIKPVSYHGDDKVTLLDDNSDDSDGDGQTKPDTYTAFKGDSGESVVGPPIHADEAGGQGLLSSLSPPESAGTIEEAGTGDDVSVATSEDQSVKQAATSKVRKDRGLKRLLLRRMSRANYKDHTTSEDRHESQGLANLDDAHVDFNRAAVWKPDPVLPEGTLKEPGLDILGDSVKGSEPAKKSRQKKGDIRDFISKYGATEHLVSVDKEKSIITNNTNDGYSVGGIIMKREMKKKWNYFEVELTAADEDGAIGIGIGHEKYQLYNMPGWEADSIGYHSDDGGLFHEAGFPSLHGPTCTIGDRMGCGVDFTHSDDGHVRVWFTKNGEVVIKPQVVELPAHPSSNFYPLICMQKPGQKAQYMGHWKEVPPTEDDEGTKGKFISDSVTKSQMEVTGTELPIMSSLDGPKSHGGVRIGEALSSELNYFEVKIMHTVRTGEIAIGAGRKDYPLHRMPGWNRGSIGYHADDGGLFHESGFPLLHGPTCTVGDRMGCGVDFTPNEDGHVHVWFTKNDQMVIRPRKVKLPDDSNLYPLMCMKYSGQQIQYMGLCKKTPPMKQFSHIAIAIAEEQCEFQDDELIAMLEEQTETQDVAIAIDEEQSVAQDDAATACHEEQPAMQGDGMNFISTFGCSKETVTVETEGKITTIRSCNEDFGIAGISMEQTMNERWNYFEVKITDTVDDGEIGIGLGHKNYPLCNMPGWGIRSIGYHADDGGLYHERGFARLHGPTCSIGDTMGCGIDFTSSADGKVRVWFTKNDKVVFQPRTLDLLDDSESMFYPLICMRGSGQEVQYVGHQQKPYPTEKDSDRMNFISTFDTTTHQVTVKKDREFSVIQSLSGQTRHSGIRMEHAMNREWNYFEVKILNTVGDGEIGIGVGHKDYLLYRLPGWDDDSIGYHADDGGLFHEAGFPELHGPTCTTGDRMGCGVDFTSSDDGHVNVWFTKNGQVVISPRHVDLPVYVDSKLYPLIGMKWAGQEVRYLGHWKKTPPTEDFGMLYDSDVEEDPIIPVSPRGRIMRSLSQRSKFDGVNLISKFGCNQEQANVQTKGGLTKICSCRDVGGVGMKQAINEKWNYFEVEITHSVEDGEIGIGLGHKNYPLSNMPGWGNHSIGYHADDGGLYHDCGVPQLFGPTCTTGDRMGCGVDFSPREDGHVNVWFTKNDKVVFYPQTVDLPVDSESKFYPLICMQGTGQEVQYVGHQQRQHPSENVVPVPWWRDIGFECEEAVPFYTKERTHQKYGKWDTSPEVRHIFQHIQNFQKSICDHFGDTRSASEYREKAEEFVQEYANEADDFKEFKAPNGKRLEPCDHIALFFANLLISAVGESRALEFFKYIGGLKNSIVDKTVFGALLYMGFPIDDLFLQHPAYMDFFLNWGANANVHDSDGKTALHLHQGNVRQVKMLLYFKAEVDVQDNSGDTPLHVAARNGRTAVVNELLNNGASNSLVNNREETALVTAAVHGNLECFKTLFAYATKSEMSEDQSGTQNWKKAWQGLASKRGQVHHENIEKMTPVQIYCATVRKTDDDEEELRFEAVQDQKTSVQRLVTQAANCDVDLTPELLWKIFDACLFGEKLVITDILEADLDGYLPNKKLLPGRESTDGAQGSENKKDKSQETSLLSYLTDRPKLFFKLAKHPTLKTFVSEQWKEQARYVFWSRLVYYIFQMIILTFAFAIAARPELTDDQLNRYPYPLDYFRGICEVLLLLMTLVKIVEEFAEVIVSRWSYLLDWTNYIELLTILFTLSIIPFRVWNHPGQWIVTSLAYFFSGFKIIEFIALFRWTGAYVHTLYIIISRDIVRFMAVFLILLVIFSGGFYFSLRYDDSFVTHPDNSTLMGGGVNSDLQALDGVARLLHEVYFTGLRALIEAGSVLNYYGANGSLRALSVIIYMVFLFIVVIVLLNVLIAQVSDTYGKVLSTAEGIYLYHQCRYIARLEAQQFYPGVICYLLPRCFERCGGACFRRCGFDRFPTCLQICCLISCIIPLCFYYCCDVCFPRCKFDNICSKERQWPNLVWIGKKRNQKNPRWESFKKKVVWFFTVYAFDEDDDLAAEEGTQKLERKMEIEHKKLEDKIEKVLSDKLEHKMEEEVQKLADQLQEKLADQLQELKSLVLKK